MNFKHYLFYSLAILLLNCGNESDDTEMPIDPVNDGVLIKQIIETDAEDGSTYSINFKYSGTKLIEISDTDAFRSTFEYDGDQLIKLSNFDDDDLLEYVTYTYNPDGILESYLHFFEGLAEELEGRVVRNYVTYNSNNTITEKIYIGDATSQSQFFHTETKTIVNGNITLETNDDSEDTEAFEFDTKNSIYKNITAVEILELSTHSIESGFQIYGSKNNVTKIIDNQVRFPIDEDRFEYTYNDNDYPLSAVYSFYSGGEFQYETTLQYIYE